MVLLARMSGLSARLVTGFAGGRRNPLGGFIELTRADAHSWVEIHFERYGWVRFDPTPADLRLAGANSISARDRLEEWASAVELWWFRHFVDYDRDRQFATFSWLARAAGGAKRGGSAEVAERARGGSSPDWIGAAGLAVFLVFWLYVRRRRGSRPSLPAEYRAALRLLRRRGFVRPPELTARAFAAEVARGTPPSAAAAFDVLTERYLAERFGGSTLSRSTKELETLRVSLRG